jgi:hypothetical protein
MIYCFQNICVSAKNIHDAQEQLCQIFDNHIWLSEIEV